MRVPLGVVRVVAVEDAVLGRRQRAGGVAVGRVGRRGRRQRRRGRAARVEPARHARHHVLVLLVRQRELARRVRSHCLE